MRRSLAHRPSSPTLKGKPAVSLAPLGRLAGLHLRCRGFRAAKSGESLQSIASRMQVGFGTVQRCLNAAGIKKRPHGLRKRTIGDLPSDPGIIGYFSGLLDGEGNIQFKPNKGKISYKLQIYNTHKGIMQWLLENIGGSVRWDYKRVERNGWKPCGIWSLYRAQDLYVILQWCFNHLVVKKDTANTLIQMLQAKGL